MAWERNAIALFRESIIAENALGELYREAPSRLARADKAKALDGKVATHSMKTMQPYIGTYLNTFDGFWIENGGNVAMPDGSVRALVALPGGRFLSGREGRTIKLWRTDGVCLHSFKNVVSSVWALAVLPDGRFLSGGDDETIKLWRMDNGACVRTFTGHSDKVNALAVLPDGRFLSGGWDKTIKLWR